MLVVRIDVEIEQSAGAGRMFQQQISQIVHQNSDCRVIELAGQHAAFAPLHVLHNPGRQIVRVVKRILVRQLLIIGHVCCSSCRQSAPSIDQRNIRSQQKNKTKISDAHLCGHY